MRMLSALRTIGKQWLVRGGVFLIVLGFILNALRPQTSQAFVAGTPGRLLLAPATGTMSTGQDFTVKVQMNSAGQAISAVQFRITYPGTDLQAVSITGNPALTSANWSFPFSEIKTQGGNTTIELMALNSSTTGYTAAAGTDLATIVFRANTAFSNKAVTFDQTISSILKKSDASDILGGFTNGTYSASGGAVAPTPTPTPTPIPPTPTPPIGGTTATPTPTPTPTPTAVPVTDGTTTTSTTTTSTTDTSTTTTTTGTTGQPEVTQPIPVTASTSQILAIMGAGVALLLTGAYAVFHGRKTKIEVPPPQV